MKTIPIGECSELPIGVPSANGQRARAYAFRPWRGKEERELALRRQEDKLTNARFITVALAHLLTTWGDKDFAQMSPAQKELAVSTSFAGDVLFAWFQLRRQALGNDLALDVSCARPACQGRDSFTYTVDFSTVDVVVVEPTDILEKPLQLRDGLPFGGQPRKVLTLAPLRWLVYESFGADPSGISLMGLAIAAGSIVGVSGTDGVVCFTPEMLDGMTKFDFETLKAATIIDPGPTLVLDFLCPQCKGRLKRQVDWTYDSFFSLRGSSPGPVGDSA